MKKEDDERTIARDREQERKMFPFHLNIYRRINRTKRNEHEREFDARNGQEKRESRYGTRGEGTLKEGEVAEQKRKR
jgi:hypothetical protein